MTMWDTTSQIISAILAEKTRAEKLHPNWPSNRIEQVAVMVEEAGEALKAVLDCRSKFNGGKNATVEELRNELIQTGAMVIRVLENLPAPSARDEFDPAEVR